MSISDPSPPEPTAPPPPSTSPSSALKTARSPFDRLYAHAKQQERKRAEMRAATETQREKEIMKECTFSPSLCSVESSEGKMKDAGHSVVSRLLKYAETRKKRVEEKRKKLLDDERSRLTFTPQLSSCNRKSSPSRKKQDVFSRLAVPKQSPTPIRKSKTMSSIPIRKNHPNEGSVHARLYADAVSKRSKDSSELEALRKELDQELTFSPRITHLTESRDGAHGGHLESPPLFDRLSMNRQFRNETLAAMKVESELDGCSFSPTINPKSQALAGPHSLPVHVRLSADAERLRQEKKIMQSKAEKNETLNCTFSPRISRAYAPSPTRRRRSSSHI